MSLTSKYFNAVGVASATLTVLFSSIAGYTQPDTVWTKTITDLGRFVYVVRSNDGGFGVGGYSYIQNPLHQYSMFRIDQTDSLGNVQWGNNFIAIPDQDTVSAYLMRITQYPDQGYLLVGSAFGYGMAVRTDSTGNRVWQRFYREANLTSFTTCVLVDSENCLIGAEQSVIKIDANGEIIWNRRYDNLESVSRILKLPNGHFVLGGITSTLGGGSLAIYASEIDSGGGLVWENAYVNNHMSASAGLVRTTDGGYCLAGTSRYSDVPSDTYVNLTRIDSTGHLLWQRVYDEYPHGDTFSDIVQTSDGGFAAAGDGSSMNHEIDFYLLRVDSVGVPQWRAAYGTDDIDYCSSVLLMADGGYVLGGARGWGFLVRTEPDPLYQNSVRLLDPAFPSLIALAAPYPNPFNNTVNIGYQVPSAVNFSLKIYDLNGRSIVTLVDGLSVAGNHSISWNAQGIPTGIYLVKLETSDFSTTNKLVLTR